MGILKGIIDRFRAMGKTENEISSIVEAAADKRDNETGKNGNFENEQFTKCGKSQKTRITGVKCTVCL